MKIFVGNLSFDATEGDVRKAFEKFGAVSSVAIVMDKKGTSSRGFGFVEMLDDQQAQAVIAAFDGKDFMGRPLNVSPSVSKVRDGSEIKEKKRGRIRGRARSEESLPTRESGYSAYKEGRRSRNFIARRAASGTQVEDRPRIKSHENPMRWRKKSDQPKPWQKSHGEPIPWKGPKPWQKTTGESKPWGSSRAGESRRPSQPRSRSRQKPGGYSR